MMTPDTQGVGGACRPLCVFFCFMFVLVSLKTSLQLSRGISSVWENPNIHVYNVSSVTSSRHGGTQGMGQLLPFSENSRSTLARASSTYPSDFSVRPANSTFAYAFLMASCDLQRPSYRGFLYNILIATKLLHQSGSTEDVVVYIRMAANGTEERLPEKEIQWLEQSGCRLMYLPKPTVDEDDFIGNQMLKFHVLDLIEYERVLYLDSDVMPLCNLDYIFSMSMSGEIKENLVVAGPKEPANGGFFMLKPGVGERVQLENVVSMQRESAKHLPYPHFDVVDGWGHRMQKSDRWKSQGRKNVGVKWNFYAAYADQGLLYYWVKYHKKSTTIAWGSVAEDWGTGQDKNGTLRKEKSHGVFDGRSCLPIDAPRKNLRYAHHPAYGSSLLKTAPFSDFMHFYGELKPWDSSTLDADIRDKFEAQSARQYFFHELRQINDRFEIGIDFDNWESSSKPLQSPPIETRRVRSVSQIRRTQQKSAS